MASYIPTQDVQDNLNPHFLEDSITTDEKVVLEPDWGREDVNAFCTTEKRYDVSDGLHVSGRGASEPKPVRHTLVDVNGSTLRRCYLFHFKYTGGLPAKPPQPRSEWSTFSCISSGRYVIGSIDYTEQVKGAHCSIAISKWIGLPRTHIHIFGLNSPYRYVKFKQTHGVKYICEEIPENTRLDFEWLRKAPLSKKGKDLALEVGKRMADGRIGMNDLLMEVEGLICHQDILKSTLAVFSQQFKTDINRQQVPLPDSQVGCVGVWLHGSSGCGKSYFMNSVHKYVTKEFGEGVSHFKAINKDGFFEGLQTACKLLICDEFSFKESGVSPTLLLNLVSTGEINLNVKFGSKDILPRIVVFISNISLDEFLIINKKYFSDMSSVNPNQVTTSKAFRRRFIDIRVGEYPKRFLKDMQLKENYEVFYKTMWEPLLLLVGDAFTCRLQPHRDALKLLLEKSGEHSLTQDIFSRYGLGDFGTSQKVAGSSPPPAKRRTLTRTDSSVEREEVKELLKGKSMFLMSFYNGGLPRNRCSVTIPWLNPLEQLRDFGDRDAAKFTKERFVRGTFDPLTERNWEDLSSKEHLPHSLSVLNEAPRVHHPATLHRLSAISCCGRGRARLRGRAHGSVWPEYLPGTPANLIPMVDDLISTVQLYRLINVGTTSMQGAVVPREWHVVTMQLLRLVNNGD